MKYAVIKILGKQYKVSEGEELLLDKITKKEDAEVLLVRDGDEVKIGKPVLEKVKISYSKKPDIKGKKIDVFKYKAKSRYRKHLGYRHSHTPVTIDKIS